MSTHAIFHRGADVRGGKCPAPSGTKSLPLDLHLHLCEQLCPWQDCADVQARLSLAGRMWEKYHIRFINSPM